MSFYNRSNGLGASASQAAAAKPSASSITDPAVKQAFVKELAQKYEMPDGKIVKGQLQANIYAENMLAEQAKREAAECPPGCCGIGTGMVPNPNRNKSNPGCCVPGGPDLSMHAQGVDTEPSLFQKLGPWAWVGGAAVGALVIFAGIKMSKKSSVAGYRRRRRSRR